LSSGAKNGKKELAIPKRSSSFPPSLDSLSLSRRGKSSVELGSVMI
jgi:hypothetical protein